MPSVARPPEAPPPQVAEEQANHTGGTQIEQFLSGLMDRLQVMSDQQEALVARVDALTTAAARPAPAAPADPKAAEAARYAAAGLIPPPSGTGMPQLTAEQAEELVAFVPKDDPMNPQNVVFDTWINGFQYRARRGQVMMLPRAHAIHLATRGHGYVVDVELMQGFTIPKLPDLARDDDWDGLPMSDQSTVPQNFYRGL